MITISVCLIVKNEEKTLRNCLESLKPVADEIIVVDTGSTDGTKAIAAEFTDKIYDFAWIDDFSAARNFAFSKATMDYIYTADADEVIDEENIELFLKVKQVLLPEIEIVQVNYLNVFDECNTVNNSKRELRPKLFKRLREFYWENPIHETVRLEPLIYNSDIEVRHLAEGNHAKRDFLTFRKALSRGVKLPKKLHSMYAKELYIAGDDEDLALATPFFEESLTDGSRTPEERQEALCVLARAYRIADRKSDFFRLCLRNVAAGACSEICIETGMFFYSQANYAEALCWLYDGIFETSPVISVFVRGTNSLNLLADCYEKTGDCEKSAEYRRLAEKWTIPDTI